MLFLQFKPYFSLKLVVSPGLVDTSALLALLQGRIIRHFAVCPIMSGEAGK